MIGEYLRELRVAKGVSQKELSALTNGEVSNAEISRLEAGIRKKPSPAILKILAPHLDVPVGALLSRAGYLDEPQTDFSSPRQAGGAAEAPLGGQDNPYMERLLNLEEEVSSLKKAGQAAQAEIDSLRAKNRQLETDNKDLQGKCDFMLIKGTHSGMNDKQIEAENFSLREKNAKLTEENRRIMNETLASIEEGANLREQVEINKKQTLEAQDAAKKARQALESALNELRELKDKGVMFVPESDEAREKEFEKLKDELLSVINQKNDLLEEKAVLEAKVNEQADAKTSFEAVSKELAEKSAAYEARVKELTDANAAYEARARELADKSAAYEARLREQADKNAAFEARVKELADKNAAFEAQVKELTDKNAAYETQVRELTDNNVADSDAQVAELTERLKTARQELERVIKEKADLEQEITGFVARVKEVEADKEKTAEDLRANEKLMEEIMENMSGLENSHSLLIKEKASLELALKDERDAARANAALLSSLSGVRVNGMDLGRIFMSAISQAASDDLDMIGWWLRALGEGTFKASDKSMLKGFLNRYSK